MSSKTIRDITALIKDTQAELDQVSERYERLKADLEAYQCTLDAVSQRTIEEEATAIPAKQLRNTMVEILRDAGTPIHYGSIYEELLQREVTVPGKDPRRNVGAHLSNDERFEKHGSGLWGLKSWKRSTPAPESTTEQRNVVSLRDRVRSTQTQQTNHPNESRDHGTDQDDEVSGNRWADVPF